MLPLVFIHMANLKRCILFLIASYTFQPGYNTGTNMKSARYSLMYLYASECILLLQNFLHTPIEASAKIRLLPIKTPLNAILHRISSDHVLLCYNMLYKK